MTQQEGTYTPLELASGIFRQGSNYAEGNRWRDCDKVRFRNGRPENMRGRTKIATTSTFIGTPRAIRTFVQNSGEDDIAFGTEAKLYINQGGANYDITPVLVSASTNNALSTTLNSKVVLASVVAHGASTGDYVVFVSQNVTVGGNVFLQGNEYVVSVITSDSFNFTYLSSAAATSASSGIIHADFLLHTGTSVNIGGLGWGAGVYGEGTYGTPRSGIQLYMRHWNLDNWGEDLIANPQHGRIYVWNASTGPNVRAQLISAAPSINDMVVISPEARHMISFGTNDEAGVYQGGLIRWSNSEDYNTWTAAATNTAGSLYVTGSSRIIGGLASRGAVIFWTDTGIFNLQYTGDNNVFKSSKLGEGCGLIGPRAAVESEGIIYWMAHDNFYLYDGRVSVMDCPLQRDIFNDLNIVQKEKCYAGTNDEFQEIIFLYPAASVNEISRYVIYNKQESCWYWGTLSDTVWTDSNYHDSVITGDPNGYLYYKEPTSVYNNDGESYESYVSSGDLTIKEGDAILYVDSLLPDFTFNSLGDINLSFTARRYLNDTPTSKGPFLVSAGTKKIDFKLRGRQFAMRVGSSVLNGAWRMGKNRLRIKEDGRY